MARYYQNILVEVLDDDIVDGTFAIENGTIGIHAFAFRNCKKLKHMMVPEGAEFIKPYAFTGCINLEEIILPNSLERLCGDAFDRCYDLDRIRFGSGLKYFGTDCFRYAAVESKPGIYKAFALTEFGELRCRDTYYEIGKRTSVRGKLQMCSNGIHYCTNIFEIFNYYYGFYGEEFVIAECEASEEKQSAHPYGTKYCARWIIPKKILSREELIELMNGGKKQ